MLKYDFHYVLQKEKNLADYHWHVKQINDKGQLRLSRKALLPNANPEKPSSKQRTTKENAASQKAPDKGTLKQTVNMPKDGLGEVNAEQPNQTSSDPKHVSSDTSNSAEDDALPQKIIKRLVSSGRDEPYANKGRPKKSIGKAVTSVSNKDESSLVNGEAKI